MGDVAGQIEELAQQLASLQNDMQVQNVAIQTLERADQDIRFSVDSGFVLMMATLVFFMQAGFSMLEAGNVRQRNTTSIILKNIGDGVLGILVYWLFGFAFAFGESSLGSNGFIGFGNFALHDVPRYRIMFFFFQAMFAMTASTIVSGGVAGRTQYLAYFMYTAVLTGFIYPVVSHWIWAKSGWLYSDAHLFDSNGLIDHAGSLVVHVTGGLSGTIGSLIVGQRRGYFDPKTGKPRPIHGHSMVLAALGTFILWFSWFGFNAGSSMSITEGQAYDVAKVVVNTAVASAASGISVSIVMHWAGFRFDLLTTMNGILAGCVAITAGCNSLEVWSAFLVGLCTGPFYILGSKFMTYYLIDDPLSVTAVHGISGIWGTLAVGIFSNAECDAPYSCRGIVYGEGTQLGVQMVGIITVVVWVAVTSSITFLVFDRFSGLRVSARNELLGLDYHLGGSDNPEWFQIQEALQESTKLDELISDKRDPKLARFAEFLSDEYTLENLEFILAVRAFDEKCEKSRNLEPEVIRRWAKKIYSIYIKNKSPKEVNIDADMRHQIDRAVRNKRLFDVTVFDGAMSAVLSVLQKNVYKRFILTHNKQELLEQTHIPKFSFQRFKKQRNPSIPGLVYEVDEELWAVEWISAKIREHTVGTSNYSLTETSTELIKRSTLNQGDTFGGHTKSNSDDETRISTKRVKFEEKQTDSNSDDSDDI